MLNPYASPLEVDEGKFSDLPLPPPQEPGLVSHVRILAILMIVHGVLCFLTGLFFVGMGIFMGFVMKEAFVSDPNLQRPGAPSPEVMAGFMTAVYVGLGGLLGVIGALQAFAGYRSYAFQSRMLSMISLVSGLGTILTCYCAPTSIALCIYGLVVYLNQSVVRAFELGSQGFSGEAVLYTFSRYRQLPGSGFEAPKRRSYTRGVDSLE